MTDELDDAWAAGPDTVAKVYRDIGENASPDLANYVENELNRLGYGLLGDEQFNEAIEAFEINTQLFPTSANTFDSLAEAHLESGDRERAIEYYQKALEVDPSFRNATTMSG